MTDLLDSRAGGASELAALPLRRPPAWAARRSVVLWCAGALLVVLGALGAVGMSRAGDRRTRVLVVSHDVPAGAVLTDTDVVVASVAGDGILVTLPEGQRSLVVGQYLRVRLLGGQLLSPGFVQSTPLVSPGRVVVAIPVTAVQLPWGVHEQSRVQLVVTPPGALGGAAVPETTVEGVVVRYPEFGRDGSSTGALSVEVEPAAAPSLVMAGRNVAVVLVDPSGSVR